MIDFLTKKIFNFLFLFMLFLSLFFCGCSKWKENNKKAGADTDNLRNLHLEIDNFLYESTLNTLRGSSGDKIYIPDSFQTLLKRTVLKDGIFYSFFELRFPDKADIYGIYDYSGLYDCNSDNGEWVDRVFFSMEEERIGKELQKMEDIVNSELQISEESAASEAEKKVEEISALEVRTFDESLGFMEFGKEIFIPQRSGDNWIFISASDDKVTRKFYDSLFRCYCEERWIINGKDREELTKTIKTEFYENSYKPSSKIFISNITDSDKKLRHEKKQIFNEKGFMTGEDIYDIFDDKKVIVSSLKLKYNSDGKVSESNVTEYKYDDKENNILSYTFNKNYKYKYNSDDIPPDFDYYEEGILKIRKSYQSADTYTNEIFFDEGFCVKNFYKDGKMIKEVFITNGNDERTKNYE